MKGNFTDEENWSSYLQNALKDLTAKEIVQESIEMVITMRLFSFRLQRRKGRPREVFLGALRTISEIGTLDYDRKGLASLGSKVCKAVNMFKRYGDGSMDQIITAFFRAENDS